MQNLRNLVLSLPNRLSVELNQLQVLSFTQATYKLNQAARPLLRLLVRAPFLLMVASLYLGLLISALLLCGFLLFLLVLHLIGMSMIALILAVQKMRLCLSKGAWVLTGFAVATSEEIDQRIVQIATLPRSFSNALIELMRTVIRFLATGPRASHAAHISGRMYAITAMSVSLITRGVHGLRDLLVKSSLLAFQISPLTRTTWNWSIGQLLHGHRNAIAARHADLPVPNAADNGLRADIVSAAMSAPIATSTLRRSQRISQARQ